MTGRRPWVSHVASAGLALGLLPALAHADAWVPPADGGSADFTLRQFDATRVFLPNVYGSSTRPGSELRYTMLRITGEHGLGHRLSIEYDLRAARLCKFSVRHGRRRVSGSTGVEDQEVGLNIGLTQRRSFADSIVLNVVAATGSVSSTPALGTGHTALEPDFQAGFAAGGWRWSLKAGPRVFVDGGAAQLRAELEAEARVSRRIELGASLFYVRTAVLRRPLPLNDRAERYDLLRPGLILKYRIARHFKPFIEYERDVAGRAIHAGRRITVGVEYAY